MHKYFKPIYTKISIDQSSENKYLYLDTNNDIQIVNAQPTEKTAFTLLNLKQKSQLIEYSTTYCIINITHSTLNTNFQKTVLATDKADAFIDATNSYIEFQKDKFAVEYFVFDKTQTQLHFPQLNAPIYSIEYLAKTKDVDTTHDTTNNTISFYTADETNIIYINGQTVSISNQLLNTQYFIKHGTQIEPTTKNIVGTEYFCSQVHTSTEDLIAQKKYVDYSNYLSTKNNTIKEQKLIDVDINNYTNPILTNKMHPSSNEPMFYSFSFTITENKIIEPSQQKEIEENSLMLLVPLERSNVAYTKYFYTVNFVTDYENDKTDINFIVYTNIIDKFLKVAVNTENKRYEKYADLKPVEFPIINDTNFVQENDATYYVKENELINNYKIFGQYSLNGQQQLVQQQHKKLNNILDISSNDKTFKMNTKQVRIQENAYQVNQFGITDITIDNTSISEFNQHNGIFEYESEEKYLDITIDVDLTNHNQQLLRYKTLIDGTDTTLKGIDFRLLIPHKEVTIDSNDYYSAHNDNGISLYSDALYATSAYTYNYDTDSETLQTADYAQEYELYYLSTDGILQTSEPQATFDILRIKQIAPKEHLAVLHESYSTTTLNEQDIIADNNLELLEDFVDFNIKNIY